MALVELQGGEFDAVNLAEFGNLPVLWRPKVRVVSRLYKIDSGKLLRLSRPLRKLGGANILSNIFSINGLFRFKPMFEIDEVVPLLFKAREKLLAI